MKDFDDENPNDETLKRLILDAQSGDTESAKTLLWHILNSVADGCESHQFLRDYAADARRKITGYDFDKGIFGEGMSIEEALFLRTAKHRPKSIENHERDWLLASLIKTSIALALAAGQKSSTIESVVLDLTATPNFPPVDRIATRAWQKFKDEAVVFPKEIYNEIISHFINSNKRQTNNRGS